MSLIEVEVRPYSYDGSGESETVKEVIREPEIQGTFYDPRRKAIHAGLRSTLT